MRKQHGGGLGRAGHLSPMGTAGDDVGQKWRVQDRCINGVGTVKGQLVEGTGTVWGQHGVSVGLYGDGLGTT